MLAAFPLQKLQRLDELISHPRWVVPVLPKGELEVLLETAVRLGKAGVDVKSEGCLRFYREGLVVSFTKIMTDEAVSNWRSDIHKCILRNCERLMELCVVKLHDDWFPLLDLLALVLNPSNKFHVYNASRPPEFKLSLLNQQQLKQMQQHEEDEENIVVPPRSDFVTHSGGSGSSPQRYEIDFSTLSPPFKHPCSLRFVLLEPKKNANHDFLLKMCLAVPSTGAGVQCSASIFHAHINKLCIRN